ncbi:hypothetical protein [Lactobacillus sp.]|uniref:hypothetical protein n=1 Tax=Lactobacillus sp. TaxID=1591 RepID=UPI002613365D|nr:hypothetical protein [Lactobacillus sp.]
MRENNGIFLVYLPIKLGKIQLIMIPKNATNRPKLVLKSPPTYKIRVLNIKMLQKALAIFLLFELADLKKTIRYCRKSVKESRLAARKKVVKSFELVLLKELDIYSKIIISMK